MDKKKLDKLRECHLRWVDLAIGDEPLESTYSLCQKDVMGFGTTAEETIFGDDAVKDLCQLGRDEFVHFDSKFYQVNSIWEKFIDEDTAIIVDKIQLNLIKGEITNLLPLRITSVFNFVNNEWKVVHWHGSIGTETEEGDTWHQRVLQRENERLQQKVEEQTAELKKSLEELKATQQQLIHSEKMASLGELTAGIAHEIKNPLNFVNNFSEVSKELLEELLEELKGENIEEVEEIAKDLSDNLEKIVHHGKRADSIVKGMLQHSRSGDGEKELVDINEMVDEYLRLAYHGHRAKEKSFNAKLVTDFDKEVPKLNIVPQEIGRVILNLFTNAFYTVANKKVEAEDPGYDPTVSASTKLNDNKVIIEIADNGEGIPEKVLNKIFQPFFTTKPTGKGTGLGLSLSYDIIKAHGGELKASSEEGKGSKFMIILPMV